MDERIRVSDDLADEHDAAPAEPSVDEAVARMCAALASADGRWAQRPTRASS